MTFFKPNASSTLNPHPEQASMTVINMLKKAAPGSLDDFAVQSSLTAAIQKLTKGMTNEQGTIERVTANNKTTSTSVNPSMLIASKGLEKVLDAANTNPAIPTPAAGMDTAVTADSTMGMDAEPTSRTAPTLK